MKRKGYGAGGAMEHLSLDGLRIDGRRPEEVRRIKCSMGVLKTQGIDGSAYLEQGNTKVLVAVYGPRETKGSNKAEEMTVDCEYSVSNFASGERRRLRKGDRASIETAISIRRMFESVLLVKQHPKSRVDIVVQVLQADGAHRCAAINATSLALVNAGVPMKDMICSASVGFIAGQCLVDLNSVESSSEAPQVEMAVVAQTGSISMVDMDTRLASAETFQHMIVAGSDACKQIYEVMSREVHEMTHDLIQSRGISTF